MGEKAATTLAVDPRGLTEASPGMAYALATHAAETGQAEVLAEFLEAGVDPASSLHRIGIRDGGSKIASPWLAAIAAGQVECMALCVEHCGKSRLSGLRPDGQSSFRRSLKVGNEAAALWLAKNLPASTGPDKEGADPAWIAALLGFDEVAAQVLGKDPMKKRSGSIQMVAACAAAGGCPKTLAKAAEAAPEALAKTLAFPKAELFGSRTRRGAIWALASDPQCCGRMWEGLEKFQFRFADFVGGRVPEFRPLDFAYFSPNAETRALARRLDAEIAGLGTPVPAVQERWAALAARLSKAAAERSPGGAFTAIWSDEVREDQKMRAALFEAEAIFEATPAGPKDRGARPRL